MLMPYSAIIVFYLPKNWVLMLITTAFSNPLWGITFDDEGGVHASSLAVDRASQYKREASKFRYKPLEH